MPGRLGHVGRHVPLGRRHREYVRPAHAGRAPSARRIRADGPLPALAAGHRPGRRPRDLDDPLRHPLVPGQPAAGPVRLVVDRRRCSSTWSAVKGLTPIIDLMHYGTPLWLDNHFVNASYPRRVAEYAARFAERYAVAGPLLHAAERAGGDRRVTAAATADGRPISRATTATSRCSCRSGPGDGPDGRGAPRGPARRGPGPRRGRRARARRLDRPGRPGRGLAQARRLLPLDLACGRVVPGPSRFTPGSWSTARPRPSCSSWPARPPRWDVLGVNFYPWSNRRLVRRRNGRVRVGRRPARLRALADVLRLVHARYGLPLMVTETSSTGTHLERARWMRETLAAVRQARAERIPVARLHLVPHVHHDRVEIPLVAQGAGAPPAAPRPLRRRSRATAGWTASRPRWSRATAATSPTPSASIGEWPDPVATPPPPPISLVA